MRRFVAWPATTCCVSETGFQGWMQLVDSDAGAYA
jgi:hypothetical protein